MVFVTAKVHFIPVAFALTCVSSVALATTAPTKKSGTDKISHLAHRTAPSVGNAHPKPVNGRQEDLFVVSSRAPNGVSNTTPGGGLLPIQTAPRLQSGVTRDFIAKQAQTSNALSLLQMSPGAVVGSADPLGLSDHAGISVRGMDVSELGLVFEGMPAGDPIYGIADTAEWADTENISRINLTQGSSDIATPSYSAVGGQISAELRNPSRRRGGFLELSGGTHATNKDFLRFDTGELGHSGVYAFVSGSYTRNNNWRGPGTNRRYHVDAKLTKSWGEGSHTAVVFTWNTVDESPTRYLSLSQWQQYGRSYNYAGQYTPGSTDYYRQFQYDRTSVMISAPTHFVLTNSLSADVTPYYQWMSGSVPSATTLSPGKIYYGNESAGTIDFPTIYDGKAAVAAIAGSNSYNAGFTGNLALHTGINTLRAGYWYGNLNKNSLYDYAPISSNGNIMDGTIRTQSGAVLATKNFHLMQQVNGFYIEDTLSLLDHRLDITAGFKEVLMSRSGTNNIPGATYSWSTNTATPLPRMSVSYKITPQDTVFFNASTGFHAPASDVPYYDAFNMSTGKLATRGRTDLKNEYAISEELGFRHTGLVNVSVGLFNYNFTNRQVSSSVYVDGALTTNFINAGGQTTRGAQAELALRPWHHFSPYVSGQYLHATLDNNLAVGNDYLPTKGKTAIMSPKFTASIGISYDDGRFFGNVYFNYVDSQYSTFMNDESIPAYKTANATLGYRMKSFGFLRSPQIMVNLINIGDSNYLSGVYSAKTNAKTTRGIYGTSIAGSAPTYYLGGGFATVVGISTGF